MTTITSAEFICSNTDYRLCPKPDKPEYAFIGRSNVGKSSLINMLVNQHGLAKTSGKPGKTQLINHFVINERAKDAWYLVDLPGYGFAKSAKSEQDKWISFTTAYLQKRKNLLCIFLLVDIRLNPQKIDLAFMEWLGNAMLPFCIVFTKADKLTSAKIQSHTQIYIEQLLQTWEELPPVFITSADTGLGKIEILNYIEKTNQLMQR